ncbi:TonB-dependent receptor plug domain-containing protein [Lysobacter sp. KIS68-7]|uniref:TonB-dependent receptor plug domain-containing protein n=1 Tax=Lysobacter sp. KIS68-7 TaxID=2904252 RepID=UPI001E3CFC74|nr:TonB-dependent receptor plug domain-containing protein [Lysobacter sp. KIS68-7]UHQ19297.1 TonB-dependent receptor plug domain-containing protein [Lysobacter sp. KIS68-7]
MRSSVVLQARLCAALLPFALSLAIAAEAPPASINYTPQDFARFAPRNALNMLQQVPGFVVRSQAQERGLGQATGNVLINGQRLSGKSNDVLAQLERIPASSVVRIELRDGASLAIPGLSGQVANIVVKGSTIAGTWEWSAAWRERYADPQFTRGSVSINGSAGRVDYTLGLSNNGTVGASGGPTTVTNADGSLRESRNDEFEQRIERPALSAQLAWTGRDSDIANVNARYQDETNHYFEEGLRVAAGMPDRFRTVTSRANGSNHELGGDYEFGLGAGRLKLIGLIRGISTPRTDMVVVDDFDPATPLQGTRFRRDSRERERIGRAEYRWKAFDGEMQMSGEYAFNRLDSAATLAVFDPASGAFVETPMPGAVATVQEDRYELMGTYGRALTPTLQLQVNAGGEYSKLAQVGAGGQVRTFLRPKGLVSIAWTPSSNTDLAFALERRVGQLDFQDFLATVDLADGQANAGNPDLVPPQTWELSLEANRKLGDWGTTTLRVYTQRIDDIVDTVPIGAHGESPGNLDTATLSGFEWKGTFPLARLGLQGGKLDLAWQMETSDVEDPLTREHRPISDNLQSYARLDFRHDIRDTPIAYGAYANYTWREPDVRLTEVGNWYEGPVFAGVFIEHKDVAGLKMRLNLGNLGDAPSRWDRTVYLDRRTGPVDFHEQRNRAIGRTFSFTVSGRF